jgi:alanine dehydrogenase
MLADHGAAGAFARDPHLRAGLNVLDGHVTFEPVAQAHGLFFTDPSTIF